MGAREQLQKQIDKKEEEIFELQDRIRAAGAYLQGLQDALKLLPKEEGAPKEITLRHGSLIAQARDVIRARGVPMHVTEILTALKRPDNSANRVSLSGSLAAYVRDKKIFTRPEPNTFGLLEFDVAGLKDSVELNLGEETSEEVKAAS